MSDQSTAGSTRKEALELGLSRYVSTSPCVHGHTGFRYTLTRNCTACTISRAQAARQRDRDQFDAARGHKGAARA